jgi:hypothetical protein
LAKVTASRGMSGKQLILCIFVMAKVTTSRGMSDKQLIFCCFVKAIQSTATATNSLTIPPPTAILFKVKGE